MSHSGQKRPNPYANEDRNTKRQKKQQQSILDALKVPEDARKKFPRPQPRKHRKKGAARAERFNNRTNTRGITKRDNNSACCERVFSLQNLILGNRWVSMDTELLRDLMFVQMNGSDWHNEAKVLNILKKSIKTCMTSIRYWVARIGCIGSCFVCHIALLSSNNLLLHFLL
eukprot:244629_1